MANKKLFFTVIALGLAYKFGRQSVTLGDVVETKLGRVRGIQSLSRDGREFYEWRGIPYAEPPVGELRYQTPRPVRKWAGVRDGSTYGSDCAQLQMFLLVPTGSEDCLFLNVASPKVKFHDAKKGKGLLPVMVWIHGGYFYGGSGSDYSPKYFMDEDVLLVTINYRLGALGFLSTQDENARGNMGLKDQSLALHWVKDNIEAFGGDPEAITVFGESAGGASAHFQMLSPKNKGIIKRAISQSGTAISHWVHYKDPVGQAHDYGSKVGCPTDSNKKLVDCLKQKDVNVLLQAHMSFMAVATRNKKDIFVPVVEAIKDDEAFFTKSAKDIYEDGEAPAIPWMAGMNTEEGLYLVAELLRNKSNIQAAIRDFGLLERTLLLMGDTMDSSVSPQLREFYFGNQNPVDMSQIDYQIGMAQAASDINFHVPGHEAIKLHAQSTGTVYPYLLGKRGPSVVDAIFPSFQYKYPAFFEFGLFMLRHLWHQYVLAPPEIPSRGAAHGDDLFMLFEFFGGIGKIDQNSIFYDFSTKMVRSWVQFASGKDPEFKGVSFPRATSDKDIKYILLNDTTTLTPYTYMERYKFWKHMNLV